MLACVQFYSVTTELKLATSTFNLATAALNLATAIFNLAFHFNMTIIQNLNLQQLSLDLIFMVLFLKAS